MQKTPLVGRILNIATDANRSSLTMLAAEIDPANAEAAAAAADPAAVDPAAVDPAALPAADPVEDEVSVEELQERNSELEGQVEDGELAVEIRGDLAAADKIVIEIHNEEAVIDDSMSAADELVESVVTTEGFLKDGGMNAQTAELHMKHLRALGAKIGFAPSTEMPSFQSFGGVGSRYDATQLVMLEQEKWYTKFWNMIKGALKTAFDATIKLRNRLFDTATKTKARAESLIKAAIATKGTPSAEKITISESEAAYGEVNTSLKQNIENVATAATKALAAAETRADNFNKAIIAALQKGYKVASEVKPQDMEEIKAPGGWGVVNNGGVATWERHKTAAIGGTVPVLSTGDIQAVGKAVLILCNMVIAAKEAGGKNAQAYKDSLAAGDALDAKSNEEGVDKAAMQAGLKKLNEARGLFNRPSNAILGYAANAGATALDIAWRMLKTYKVPKAAKAPAAEPAAPAA